MVAVDRLSALRLLRDAHLRPFGGEHRIDHFPQLRRAADSVRLWLLPQTAERAVGCGALLRAFRQLRPLSVAEVPPPQKDQNTHRHGEIHFPLSAVDELRQGNGRLRAGSDPPTAAVLPKHSNVRTHWRRTGLVGQESSAADVIREFSVLCCFAVGVFAAALSAGFLSVLLAIFVAEDGNQRLVPLLPHFRLHWSNRP